MNPMKASEAQIQKSILDWLAAKRVLAFRMNVGISKAEYRRKRDGSVKSRHIHFGVPGMADILAFRNHAVDYYGSALSGPIEGEEITPVWIECKTEKGEQSALQQSFQEQVEEHGHTYVIARSIDDIERLF